MNGTMRNLTAVMTLVTAVIAIFVAGVWASFMFSRGPFASSVSGIDWVPLIVFLTIGFGLFWKTYKLTGPWQKEMVWSLTSLFVGMVMYFIWAATPLSSCSYFPTSPAQCDMYGGPLLDAR
jgi:hypothetical protein